MTLRSLGQLTKTNSLALFLSLSLLSIDLSIANVLDVDHAFALF